jgi:hypothetical protein
VVEQRGPWRTNDRFRLNERVNPTTFRAGLVVQL